MQPSKQTSRHKKLADKLVSLHQNDSPYTKFPAYDFNQLRKGITCEACNSFKISVSVGEKKLVCDECGHQEGVESAVLRCVKEIKFLFKDKRITTNSVHEWCKVIKSERKINRILSQSFNRMGHGKFSYYVND
jgi:hypothetical protein